MKLRAKVFESASKSWEQMCDEVSEFASQLGPQRIVNVSMASSGGGDWTGVFSTGTIIVWYWA